MHQTTEPTIGRSGAEDPAEDRVAESGIGLLSIIVPAAAGAFAGRIAGGSPATAVFGAVFAGISGLVLYLVFSES